MRRDSGICQPCNAQGQLTAATQVDHIRNKAQGGSDDDSNLQAICTRCHNAKSAAEAAGRTWDGTHPVTTGLDGWPL